MPAAGRRRIDTITPSSRNRSQTSIAASRLPPGFPRRSRITPEGCPAAAISATARSSSPTEWGENRERRISATPSSPSRNQSQEPSARRRSPQTVSVRSIARSSDTLIVAVIFPASSLASVGSPSGGAISSITRLPAGPRSLATASLSRIRSVAIPSIAKILSPAAMPASHAGDPTSGVITEGSPSRAAVVSSRPTPANSAAGSLAGRLAGSTDTNAECSSSRANIPSIAPRKRASSSTGSRTIRPTCPVTSPYRRPRPPRSRAAHARRLAMAIRQRRTRLRFGIGGTWRKAGNSDGSNSMSRG